MRIATTILFSLLPIALLVAAISAVPVVLVLLVIQQLIAAIPQRLRFTPHVDKIFLFLLALVMGWSVISGFWSLDPSISFDIALGKAGLCLAGIAVWKLASDTFLTPRALTGMAAAILLVAACLVIERLPILGDPTPGLLGPITHWLLWQGFDSIPKFIYQDVNRGLVVIAVLIWPLSYGLYRLGQRKLACATIAAYTVAMFLMDSQSAQIAMVAGLVTVTLVWLAPRRFPLLLPIVVPGFLLLLPMLTYWFLQTLPWLTEHQADIRNLFAGRVEIWDNILARPIDRFWVGHGVKTAGLLSTIQPPAMYPHHSTLQLWLELGAIGLLLVSGALGRLLWQLRAHPARLGILASIAAYLGAGLFSFSVWQSWWFMVPFLCLLFWKQLLQLLAMR